MLSDKNSSAIVAVSDIEKARRFYEEKLGLTCDSGDEKSAFSFRTGDTHLTVYESENASPAGGNAVVWGAGGEVEAIADDLRGKGVRLEEYPDLGMQVENGIHSQGDFKAIWFKDPDGNILHVNSM